MRYFLCFIFVVTAAACASKERRPAADVKPAPPLELSQALTQGAGPTLAQLKTQTTAKPFDGMNARDPATDLPKNILAERGPRASKEKSQQQQYFRKFRVWGTEKRSRHANEMLTEFTCNNALEAQAMALILELDFPESEAVTTSQSLHEKVLTCQAFPRQDSLLKLAVFAIQRNECPKAMEYLNMFPPTPERGVNDRLAYIRSLCSPTATTVENRNPWGGYGILLHDVKLAEPKPVSTWMLSTSSGNEDWDRLLATFLELHQKGQLDTVHYLATKINYEKFRALPLSFQTSMLVLMSFAGADLPVFQTLHKYLSEHPEMVAPSVAGLLFPTRYWEKIVEQSRKADPILVKALIRQESAFNPLARSRAKAAGLMQLIYPTAKNFGVKKPKELLDPEANIHAGSEFLAQLISDFGSVELALAAYNAGPAMVRQWQRRYPTSNMDLFVEMIPYSETREYVRLVKRNYKVYQGILSKPQVLGKVD